MHEALAQQPSAEHPEGTVVAELGKGYRIKDRVLRPTARRGFRCADEVLVIDDALIENTQRGDEGWFIHADL